VSDELLRRFRNKIRGRPSPRPHDAGDIPEIEEEAPADSIAIRDLEVGPFPSASRLNPRFIPGVPRVRLTLDLGENLRGAAGPLGAAETAQLLALCPRLLEHDCEGGNPIQEMLSAPHHAPPQASPGPETGDGLVLAHLIEHVAIDLIAAASGATRCSGVTCAYAGRLDRFDIFLECADPPLGRAVALLATAIVRDLCSGRDRLASHRRCRDLLAHLTATRSRHVAPEDVASSLDWSVPDALESLDGLVRLGYLDPLPATFTFSTSTGLLFRRASTGGAPGRLHRGPAPPGP
jgi:hypothetical protein